MHFLGLLEVLPKEGVSYLDRDYNLEDAKAVVVCTKSDLCQKRLAETQSINSEVN